jgi:hypothetical protein
MTRPSAEVCAEKVLATVRMATVRPATVRMATGRMATVRADLPRSAREPGTNTRRPRFHMEAGPLACGCGQAQGASVPDQMIQASTVLAVRLRIM